MQASIKAVYYSHTDSPYSSKIRKYAWIVAIGWTLLLLASSLWDIAVHRRTLVIVAHSQARASIERDGLNASLSFQPVIDATDSQTTNRLVFDAFIWLLGLGITVVGATKLSRGAREQKKAEIELHEQTLQLEGEIAERQRAQESLQASQRQLRQTQKMEVIGQLAGGVAHDFNNMLTAIIGSSELLEHFIRHDPAAIKLLGSIQQAASRSAELTQQLLVFSREGQKNYSQVCINEIITASISLLEHSVDKKISLKTSLAARNTMISGDTTFLQNALLNLGVNARDAMPEGGVITFATNNVELDSGDCELHVLPVDPGQFLEISVSDNGMGMSEDVVERIFEPFFTTKGVGKGTGLGLAAVYSTVREHHGSINVSSECGAGTIFRLYLPLSDGKKNVNTFSAEVTQGDGGILLVDDEALIRDMGRELLQNAGYRVFLAEDGEQALEVYAREKEKISLVILDMVMPRMGGKETLECLLESYPDVRVLIASGYHQESTVETLIDLGAKDFIQKPYSKFGLCKAVADTIGG